MAYQPRIAIIGAGPAGLTLALLLHQQGIQATVYELRPQPTEQELAQPSGMLDLHNGSGIAAIRACGIYEEFKSLTGECSESTRVLSKHGELLYADSGQDSERPEISRHALIGLLIKKLPRDTIQWNTKVLSVKSAVAAAGNTEITIQSDGADPALADLVIGADGAWSKVRGLVTNVAPHYSGTQYMYNTIPDIQAQHPRLAKLIGTGTMFALADHKGIITHRTAQGAARIDLGFEHADEHYSETAGWAHKSRAELREVLLKDEALFADWSPALRELIAISLDDATATINPQAQAGLKGLYMLPVDHRWDSKPGVTLIGDAAHLMTPWAGEGVNLAMWDALDLSRALAKVHKKQPADVLTYQRAAEPVIRDFERAMQKRARSTAAETWSNKQLLLGEDGSAALTALFRSFESGIWGWLSWGQRLVTSLMTRKAA